MNPEVLHHISHTLIHSLTDTLKLVPLLFLTYLLMEYFEHKAGSRVEAFVKKSGKFGPVYGSLFGLIPQCGFSGAAANLYAGRIISLGTLIAIFLTTSDEMLPILISSSVEWSIIAQILGIKLAVGLLAGFIIDLLWRNNSNSITSIHQLCQDEHCHCEEHGIVRAAILHTLHITLFLFIVSLVLHVAMEFAGEELASTLRISTPILGEFICGLIGLIPNCSASVLLTDLYVEGILSNAEMISGLLVNSGVGLLVLFRMNRNVKENIKIAAILFVIGVVVGVVIELIGYSF